MALDYQGMRRMVAYSPEEEAAGMPEADYAYETSPAQRGEMLNAIRSQQDPSRRMVLAQAYQQNFGESPPGIDVSAADEEFQSSDTPRHPAITGFLGDGAATRQPKTGATTRHPAFDSFLSDASSAPQADAAAPGIMERAAYGLKRTISNTALATKTDPREIAANVAQSQREALPQSPAMRQMQEEIAPYAKDVEQSDGLDSVVPWIKLYAKRAAQFASNPREFVGSVVENLPNSAPGLAAGIAGAYLTPIPHPAAKFAGGVAGGIAGGYLVEKGASLEEQIVNEAVARGINPKDEAALLPLVQEKFSEFESAAQRKGLGTAATDAVLTRATLGLGGMAKREVAKEAAAINKAIEAGTLSGKEAAQALATLEARAAALNTIPRRAVRGAGMVAGEMGGESLSEAAGQKWAYGKVNPLDVADEGILALGQGGAMALGGRVAEKALGLPNTESIQSSVDGARKSVEQGPTLAGKPLKDFTTEQLFSLVTNQSVSDSAKAKIEAELLRRESMDAAQPNPVDIQFTPGQAGTSESSEAMQDQVASQNARRQEIIDSIGFSEQQAELNRQRQVQIDATPEIGRYIPANRLLPAPSGVDFISGSQGTGTPSQWQNAGLDQRATERQIATARGLLNHSPKASPELLQRLMRVDQDMAVALFNHWKITESSAHGNSQAASIVGGSDGREMQGAAARDDSALPVPDMAQHEGQVPQSEESLLPQLRGEGDQGLPGVDGQLPSVPSVGGESAFAAAQPGQDQQQRGLSAGKRPLADQEGAGAQHAQEPLADAQRNNKAAGGMGGGNRAGSIDAPIPAEAGRNDGRGGTDDGASGREEAIPTFGQRQDGTVAIRGFSRDEYRAAKKALGLKNVYTDEQGGAVFPAPAKGVTPAAHLKTIKKALGYVEPKEVRTAARKPATASNILQAIVNRGGINRSIMGDVGGDPGARYMPGLFTNNGTTDLSALAGSLFEEDGFHQIHQDSPVGPARELEDLITRALGGEKILSTTAMEKSMQAEENAKLKEKAQRLGVKTVARKIEDIAADVARAEEQSILDEETRLEDDALLAYNDLVDALNAAIGEEDAEGFIEQLASRHQDDSHLTYLRNAITAIKEKLDAEVQSAGKPEETAAGTAGPGSEPSRAQGGADALREAAQAAPALSSYTEEDLAARDREQKAAEAQRLKDEQAAENKRQADAERGSFNLTGSDRPADVLAAQGQGGLFDSAPSKPKEDGYADTPRIRKLKQKAAEIEASIPPVRDGMSRLWRGNRPGEVGLNPQFTNSLVGIAIPFAEAYGGPVSYIDVPMEDLGKYENRGVAASGSEFIVPADVARTAKVVGAQEPPTTIAGKPVTEMSDDQLRNIARGLSPTFGEAAVDKAKTEINRRYAALRDAKPKESAIDTALRSVGVDPNAPADEAKTLRREAEKLQSEAREMLDRIPPGQPVSSTRDRNLREKSAEKSRKAGELFDRAEAMDAQKVGAGATVTKDQGPHFASGVADFKAGKPRELPSYFTKTTGKNPRDWYRGWDEAKASAQPDASIAGKPVSEMSDGMLDQIAKSSQPAAEKAKAEVAKRKKPKSDPLAAVREFYTPGNIIHVDYWNQYDKVLEFKEGDLPGQWNVKVQQVKKDGDQWVPKDDRMEPPRWHATAPGKDKIVDRVAMPNEQGSDSFLAKPEELDADKIKAGYAHRSHSLSGKVEMERKWYVDAVQAFYDSLLPLARNDAQKAKLEQLTRAFRDEYRERRYRVLDIGSSTYSAAIAGPSNFNSKQSAQRFSSLDKAEKTFNDWATVQDDAAKPALLALRTDDEMAVDKDAAEVERVKKALKPVMGDLAMIGGIDTDQAPGMDRAAFVNGALRKIKNLSDAGDSATLRKVFAAISAWDEKHEKPLFSSRSPVWQYKPEAEEAPVIEKSEAAPDSMPRQYNTMDDLDSAIEGLYDGTLSPDDYKSAFRGFVANKEAIAADLNKLTKDQLYRRIGKKYGGSETKPEAISRALDTIQETFALRRSYGSNSYTMGPGMYEKYKADKLAALTQLVEESTAAALKEFSDEVAKTRSARQEKLEGAKDPKTIEDFDTALRLKKSEGMTFAEARMSLTPEQRAEYDRLKGMQSRDERKARADQQKTDIRVAATTAEGQIVETKHTKTGEPLFVVKAAERVARDVYNQWNMTAKRIGGWYSSYRGNGAVPGFQFKTRENADAFLAFIGGNAEQAQEAVQARRDAFVDDKSQSAIERLTEMAERMEERADESLGRERKENTDRRARMAANAEAAANSEKAMATTMRRIAAAISDGTAQFLDRVRQKAQIEYLTSALRSAQYKELQAKYDSYSEQEKHRGDPVTAETADYAVFPQYSMMRSDLANLARQMIVLPNMKMLGQRVLKAADDTSDAYTKFAKEHLLEVSRFGKADGSGMANFSTMKDAERSIEFSKLGAIAVPLQIKRGEYRIILSPSEAINKGIWKGDDRLITLDPDVGAEIVEKLGRLNRKTGRRGMDSPPTAPWQFENAYNDRKRLAGMGIEQPWEFRAALREFAGLKESPKERDKIKQMERAMIGRKNDGLDFFPTPAGVADELVQAAGIEEGMAVLEPSAGMGHIAERIRAAGVDPDVVEMASDRRELLEAKGLRLVGADFMDMSPRGFTYGDVFRDKAGVEGIMRGSGGLGSNRVGFIPVGKEERQSEWRDRDELQGVRKNGSDSGYDRIIMNPPFSDRRDAQHVQHAYTLLKPGGRLVAIMGEGVFFGQDKKAQAFRNWLEEVGGTSEKLDEGTFMDPSLPVNTAVNARMVVIDKPEGRGMESRSAASSTPELPDVIIGNPLGEAKGDDYGLAKAGSVAASMRLAQKLVTADLVEKLRDSSGENPLVVGVNSVEAAGKNALPRAGAEIIAHRLGLDTAPGIVQSTSPKRTGMDGLNRIFARPEFDGDVVAGRGYILVDDTLTQGGTFAALAKHIEAGGGHVVAIVALTGKQYSSKLSPSEETIGRVREKFGDIEDEFRNATGYGFDDLTESEARYLASFDAPDTIRDRILAENGHQPVQRNEGNAPEVTGAIDDKTPPSGGVSVSGARSLISGIASAIFPDEVLDGVDRDADGGGNLGIRRATGPHGERLVSIPADALRAANVNSTLAQGSIEVGGIGPDLIGNSVDAGSSLIQDDGSLNIVGNGSAGVPGSRRANAASSESGKNSRPVQSAKGIRDLLIGGPLLAHLKRLVEIPGQRFTLMKSNMVPSGENLKIVDGVIQAIPVDMVDVFVSGKTATGKTFSNLSMFVLPGNSLIESVSLLDDVSGTAKAIDSSGFGHDLPSYKNTSKIRQLEGVVKRFLSIFPAANQLSIKVVWERKELPAHVKASPNAEAIYLDNYGQVFLVASNIFGGDSRTFQILLHECVGHFGLAQMMGSRFAGILKQVQQAAKAKGEVTTDIYEPGHPDYATMEAVRLRYPEASDEEVAQEVLARMAETDPGRTLFGYVRAVVRQWLRDMARAAGFDLDVTTAELNDLVAQASAYMRRGDNLGSETIPTGAAVASKASGMESRAAPTNPQGPIWSSPEASRADDLIYTMQDKNVDLKRVQQGITKALGNIRDDVDAYLQEELFHGRAAKATEEFLERELQPFVGEMKQRGIDMNTLETFLWARHAKERNAQIAKINPDMPDGGSGLTDKQAADILAGKDVTTGGQTVNGVPQAKMRSLKDLAVKVDRMVAGNRILTETYELETPDTVAAWKGAYQHYVPLHREDADSPWAGTGTGQGYSVKGSSTKRATGSFRPVENILANLVLQRTRTITRGEKNRVAQALYGLAKESPNKGFWDTDNAPTIRTVENKAIYHVMDGKTEVANFTRMADAEKKARENPAWFMYQDWGDRVVEKIDPTFRSKPNVVWARFGGEDRFVIFNERDERAMRLAGSLKNLDADDISNALGEVARWTRYFSSINTQYNPVFGVINLIRDTGTGLLNLKSTPLDGKQAQLLGNVWQALPAIYKAVRTDRAGGTPTGVWADLWEEFQEVGGKTGYRDMFKNSHEQHEALQMALDPTWWQGKWWGKALTVGGVLSVPEQLLADKIGKPVFEWLSDYNTMMENGIRLSAYKLAIDDGMTKERAASLAKNLTVNFNKKGQVARQAGALYAFFNASVQGTARMAETLHHGAKPGELLGAAGKQIVYGGMLLGAMQAMLLMIAGFDDDEPPEFVRDRNIIIPAVGGKYLTVPLPLGFHVLPAIGRVGTEFVLGGFKNPGKHVAHIFDVLADSFNPIGNAGLSMQTLAPTVLDPAAALAENKDWTGKPIFRENMSGIDQKPGHARTKDTATGLSKGLAYAINAASGGTEFKPGMLSPTPDQIDYLIGQVTGGVGRETSKAFQTASAAFTGEELPTYKIPLVGRFYGDTKGQAAVSGKFYENLKEMNEHQAEFMGLAKSNRGTQAQEYARENPEAMMFREGDRLQRYISNLRDQKRTMLAKGEPREKIKAVDDQITKTMQGFNQRVDLKKNPQRGMTRVEVAN